VARRHKVAFSELIGKDEMVQNFLAGLLKTTRWKAKKSVI